MPPDPKEVRLKSLLVFNAYNGVLLGVPEPAALVKRGKQDAARQHGQFVDSLVVEPPAIRTETYYAGTVWEKTHQRIPEWQCMVRFGGPAKDSENFQEADIILLFWQDMPHVDLDAVKARALTYWADHAKDWEW